MLRSIKKTFIYAYYGTGTNAKKIGKINITALKKREEKVILVAVLPPNTTAIPTPALAPSAIQTYLNGIYKGANVEFTITSDTTQFDLGTGANAGLERSDESMFGKYSLEMRALKSHYMAKHPNYDKKATYIFVVPSFSGSGTLSGFMVRGRSVGFVTGAADMRTYAHELGHGVFGLEHTFPEIEEGKSNNLMDYVSPTNTASNTHLTHKQWKIMHARKPAYSWFDSEEDGSLINSDFKCVKIHLYKTKDQYGNLMPNFSDAELLDITKKVRQIFEYNGLPNVELLLSPIVVYGVELVNSPVLRKEAEDNPMDCHVGIQIASGTGTDYAEGNTLSYYDFTTLSGNLGFTSFSIVDADNASNLINNNNREELKYAAAFGIAHEVWHQLMSKTIHYFWKYSNHPLPNTSGGNGMFNFAPLGDIGRVRAMQNYLFNWGGGVNYDTSLHWDSVINLNMSGTALSAKSSGKWWYTGFGGNPVGVKSITITDEQKKWYEKFFEAMYKK